MQRQSVPVDGVADAGLFFHLIGGLLFVAGIIVAGIAHGAARRRHHAGEVVLLLGIARTGALLVAVGALLMLVPSDCGSSIFADMASVRPGSSAR